MVEVQLPKLFSAMEEATKPPKFPVSASAFVGFPDLAAALNLTTKATRNYWDCSSCRKWGSCSHYHNQLVLASGLVWSEELKCKRV